MTPVVIPNGCNDAGDNDAVPAVPLRLPRPVVGLVGQLSDRIDLDIVEGVVDAGLSLLLVGPKDPRWEPERFDSLVLRPGVHFAGPVPADEVPSYLAAIDVGITPYRDSPFNQASFPLKTLEYLGAGRPVVSTALPSAALAEGRSGQARYWSPMRTRSSCWPMMFLASWTHCAGLPTADAD